MSVDQSVSLEEVLHRARATAFGPREFVGQESFVTRSEILALARAAGIRPGVSVLDVCCGAAGPGLFLAGRLGCTYVGVDERATSVARARRRVEAEGARCRVEVARVPPLPPGRFDVVLLLETLLAFPDRGELLEAVAAALPPGGRFALTAEAGHPLTPDEAAAMPGSHTVWLTPLDDLVDDLARVRLRVRSHREWTASHRATVSALVAAYADATTGIRHGDGRVVVEQLVTAHRLWSQWLREGRVRKHALVAEHAA